MMLTTFFKKQKGAMFGLDARIALAIFGGLSVVMGASMIQVMGDNRAENILAEHARISGAVDALQEDLQTNIDNALTTIDNTERYMALAEEAGITAAFQGRWHGPYIPMKGSQSQHSEYGAMGIAESRADASANCLATHITSRQCYYYLEYQTVPTVIINQINTQLDGAAEATPASNGMVQWGTIVGQSATLYMRLGLVSP